MKEDNTSSHAASRASEGGMPPATLVRKPIELICCAPGQQLTFVQRRLLTAICQAITSARVAQGDEVSFSSKEICKAMGFNINNVQHLYQACMRLVDMKAWLNPLDSTSAPLTQRVFGSISVQQGSVCFLLEPGISELIRSGEVFAEVDLETARQLGGANTLTLYEICLALLPDRVSPLFPEARWRLLITGLGGDGKGYRLKSKLLERSAHRLREVAGLNIAICKVERGINRGQISLKIHQSSKSLSVQSDHGPLGKEVGNSSTIEETSDENPLYSNEVFEGEESVSSSIAEMGKASSVESAADEEGTSAAVQASESEASAARRSFGGDCERPTFTSLNCGPGTRHHQILANWEAAHAEVLKAAEVLRHAKQSERAAALNVVRILIGAYRLRVPEVFGEPEGLSSPAICEEQ